MGVRNYLIILILVSAMIASCDHKERQLVLDRFYIPKIIQPQIPDSDHFFTEPGRPFIIGRSKFVKSISMNPDIMIDTSWAKDFFYEFRGKNDTFPGDGLEVQIDYKSTIFFNGDHFYHEGRGFYFPAYIINSTNSTKYVRDRSIEWGQVQEAMFDYSWAPVQKSIVGCGNGVVTIAIRPKEFLIILVPKLKPVIPRKMRLHLDVGWNDYYSQPFNGFIAKDTTYKRDGW